MICIFPLGAIDLSLSSFLLITGQSIIDPPHYQPPLPTPPQNPSILVHVTCNDLTNVSPHESVGTHGEQFESAFSESLPFYIRPELHPTPTPVYPPPLKTILKSVLKSMYSRCRMVGFAKGDSQVGESSLIASVLYITPHAYQHNIRENPHHSSFTARCLPFRMGCFFPDC